MMTTYEAKSGWMQTVLHRQGVRQFVKFCIVGASSTLIDFGLWLLLMEKTPLVAFVGSVESARTIAQIVSFAFAVTNGFILNNHWTFKDPERAGGRRRYGQFVLTNIIGLGLNITILNLVAHSLPASVLHLAPSGLKDPAGFIGKIVATGVVVFWNFTASKYWTFKS